MSLNFATIRTLFGAELRMAIRDRRMVVAAILLPLLVTPLMFLGSTLGIKRHERKLQEMEYLYAIQGPQAAFVREVVANTTKRLASAAATSKTVFRLKEVTCQNTVEALNKGDIQFILEGSLGTNGLSLVTTNAATNTVSRKLQPNAEEPLHESAVAGVPAIRIIFRADRHESAAGMSRLRDALAETRRAQRSALLTERGFPVPPAKFGAVTPRDLASTSQVAGLTLGKTLTVLLLLFIFSSGAVVATDSLAGEKERGTLETLLTTAAGRLEVLAAKQLVIVAVALVITSIQILNLLVYVQFKLIPVPPNWAAAITPSTALMLFVLYLPMTALAANVLLLVSGYARTYKEAQLWFLPVLLVGMIPALAPALPGIPLRSAIVLVPIANIAVAAKEILVGSYDWPMIAVSWLTTGAAAVWTARFGVRTLVQERLITAAEMDQAEFTGGPALFERQVLLWYAGLWGLLLIISNSTEKLDLRMQVVINLVGLFFGSSLLMIRRYRLPVREALALRLPRPAVWLGVALGIPGGFLTAIGLFRLANLLIPSPSKITESFDESVLPGSIPTYQLLLCLTVLPGIFEEIAFRGMLLHGLRRRFHPVMVAVIVGVVFGVFHVALFRLVPTAALGIMFAAVTLLTGSIFPAMIWHACSNAFGVLAYRFKFPENDLDGLCYLGGAGLLAIAFWIFWRHRTPYPGLRGASAFARRRTSS